MITIDWVPIAQAAVIAALAGVAVTILLLTLTRITRRLHQAYAWLFGYFWLPCPLCGRHFGGHERHGVSIPVPGKPGTHRLTCRRHAPKETP